LDGSAAAGLSVPATHHPGCFNYAQGGARVQQPVGPGNKLLGGSNATLGQLTVPLVTQMSNHLARTGGGFAGNELVTVFAGGNDLFMQMAAVGAAARGGATAVQLGVVAGWTNGADAVAATLAGGGSSSVTTATEKAVTAMGLAGATLADLVKTQLAGKGAKKILVLNLSNVSKTPYGLAQAPDVKSLIDLLTTTFNSQLEQGLRGTLGVVLVDTYTESTVQALNPVLYGLTNVSTPACDKDPARNFLGGTALACTAANVIAGDVSHYLYADDVHPTPFGYQLLAKLVLFEMAKVGWL
jgi:phospholipase/lecithinase/hemolysin